MSGGSFDYFFFRFEEEIVGFLEDDALNTMAKDFVKVLHDLEWHCSGDISQDDYRATVKRFKDKWIKSDASESEDKT